MNDAARPLTAPQRRIGAAIIWYQRLREGRPSPCRFSPTCSSYALEAVETHGTLRGGWLAVRRLARCRPLGPSGFDPVPQRDDDDADATQTSPAPTSPAQKGG